MRVAAVWRRGTSSFLALAFAVFPVALGMLFVFGAFSAWFRDFRFGSQWIKVKQAICK